MEDKINCCGNVCLHCRKHNMSCTGCHAIKHKNSTCQNEKNSICPEKDCPINIRKAILDNNKLLKKDVRIM